MQDNEKEPKNEGQKDMSGEKETDIKSEEQVKPDENSTAQNEPKQEGSGDQKYNELNDRYLRLYSEFDNYRRRTLKEKSEILKTASEDVLKAILPVIDDFERAARANEKTDNVNAVKEGYQLIFSKLRNVAQQKGLTSFDCVGQAFDPDLMEAITHVPAADEKDKGKVIDEVEKGYKLGDKVIRFAKVVVAN